LNFFKLNNRGNIYALSVGLLLIFFVIGMYIVYTGLLMHFYNEANQTGYLGEANSIQHQIIDKFITLWNWMPFLLVLVILVWMALYSWRKHPTGGW